ncbi:MAG: redoxin domain-containing protein [Phycisphaerales bacterium]
MRTNLRVLGVLAACGPLAISAWAQEVGKPAQVAQPAGKPADVPKPAEAAPPAERSAEQKLFDEAADVVKRARGITFRAGVEGTDGMAQAYPKARVEVKAARTPAGGFFGWLVRVTGTMDRKDKDALPVDIAWTTGSVEAVDTEKKEVHEKPVRQMTAAPGLQIATASRLKEVFANEPFSLERGLTGKDPVNYTNEGTKTIDGVECEVLLLDRAGRKSRWAIGKADHFPRMYEQIMEGFISGVVRIEISGVHIDNDDPPAVKPEELRVTVPEGFREVRVSVAPPAPSVPAVAKASEQGEKPAEAAPAVTVPQAAPVVESAPAAAGPREAPAFELKTPTGEVVKLADLRGRVVVAYFFGSWCLECPEWTLKLGTAVKPFKAQDVELLALSVRERDDANATSEIGKSDAGFRHLVKADAAGRAFGVHTFPATFVVDKAGMITGSWQGETADDAARAVADAINAALAAKV